MLRSLKQLIGYRIETIDGSLGPAHDFFFDDQDWIIRYIVVDTGRWLSGRKVLISPTAILDADWDAQMIRLTLTRQQVIDSPGVESDKPVSRQLEGRLSTHYGWPVYWQPSTVRGAPAVPKGTATLERETQVASEGDPHLRSVSTVRDYQIHASDGDIGHVEDFIADDQVWAIRYLVVDTRNWLPGRKVLVAPKWIEGIDWGAAVVQVGLTRKAVQASPQYDPAQPVNRAYEARLYDYYGRPQYW